MLLTHAWRDVLPSNLRHPPAPVEVKALFTNLQKEDALLTDEVNMVHGAVSLHTQEVRESAAGPPRKRGSHANCLTLCRHFF